MTSRPIAILSRPVAIAIALVLAACHHDVTARTPSRSRAEAETSLPSWSELRHAAHAARVAHDYPAYRAAVHALYERSGSSLALYELAIALTLNGERAAALDSLRDYAAMGLAEGPEPAHALDPLRSDPSFSVIRARMERNLLPVAHAQPVHPLPKDDLITEDIAYDPNTRTIFVSSVRSRKVLALDERGVTRDFVANDPALGSAGGIVVHRDRLWVASAELPPMTGYEATKPHPTALLAYDLATGRRIERIPLDTRDAGDGEHALTDLTAAPDGTVFASDALGGGVYALPPGHHALEPLCPKGTFVSPQTPALSADGRALFVPDYARGIARLDLATATRDVVWLDHPNVATDGIDGLYAAGSRLYAVQNGTRPVRVVRFDLDGAQRAIVGSEVLEQGTPGLGEPTHGVFVGGSFYFLANAGWTRTGDDGRVLPDAPPDAPAVWGLPVGTP
jgi:sugar lactone lactonase YvrE